MASFRVRAREGVRHRSLASSTSSERSRSGEPSIASRRNGASGCARRQRSTKVAARRRESLAGPDTVSAPTARSAARGARRGPGRRATRSRSPPPAIVNAIDVAREMVEADVVDEITAAMRPTA